MRKWFNDSAGGSGGGDSNKGPKDVSASEAGGKPGKQMHIDKKKRRGSKKRANDFVDGGDISKQNFADTPPNGAGGAPDKWMHINKKKSWSLKKKIMVSCAGVITAVLLGVGAWGLTLAVEPLSGLDTIVDQTSFPPGESTPPQYSNGQLVTPTPTIDPYVALMNRSDTSILEHTINILLIGVDHAPERETWGGKKSFHSDVMIVLAINTDTNEVNMISLPRDTYARIPGVEGIYKLNASLDCGGGWVAGSDPAPGCFDKVCESASWMLGGIPVKYYYAVDMTAVKGLVDNIGGVDYDLDISFRIQGRSYEMGRQHMDGQAVLDYMRVRHNEDIISPKGQASDVHRVERQKKMLVAIFNKLRSTGLIYNVDGIISAFSGNLFTNVPLDQTAAIAAYAVNVDPNNIKMNSMVGKMQYGIFNWNFTITDQKKRVELIRHIYGNAAIDLYNIHEYSLMQLEYVKMLWEQMQIEVVTNVSRPLLDQVKEILDDDADLPDYPVPTATLSPSPSPTVSPDPETSPTPTPSPTTNPSPTTSPTPIPSEGYRQYLEDGEIWTIYNRAEAAYQQLLLWDFDDTSSKHLADTQTLKNQLKADIMDLYEKLTLGTARTESYWDRYVWHVIYGDTDKKLKESDYNQSIVHNEVPVDFN